MRQKFATTQDFVTPEQKLEGTSETRRLGRECGWVGGGRRGLFEVFFHFINRSESRLHSISTASPREGKTEELQSERVQGSTSEEALHPLEPLEPLEPLGCRCRTPVPWFPPCGEHRCAAHSAHCLGRRWTPHWIGRCARSTFANVCREIPVVSSDL